MINAAAVPDDGILCRACQGHGFVNNVASMVGVVVTTLGRMVGA